MRRYGLNLAVLRPLCDQHSDGYFEDSEKYWHASIYGSAQNKAGTRPALIESVSLFGRFPPPGTDDFSPWVVAFCKPNVRRPNPLSRRQRHSVASSGSFHPAPHPARDRDASRSDRGENNPALLLIDAPVRSNPAHASPLKANIPRRQSRGDRSGSAPEPARFTARHAT